MFTARDIKWVRNVKRDGGELPAYLEENTKDEFILQWSDRYVDAKEALKPKIGELILVFQNINKHKGIQLTHLVTPLERKHVDCSKENAEYPWGRKVAVIARVKDGYNPKPNDLNFVSVGRTHSFDIEKIKSNPIISKEALQKKIWNTFTHYFKEEEEIEEIYYRSLENNIANHVLSAIEGTETEVIRKHILRERSSALVIEKKRIAKEKGELQCKCCGFDFEKTYPDIGEGYIECHHMLPINQGERITKLEDLALVCANCHRMLHRKNNDDNYYHVEELKEIINNS